MNPRPPTEESKHPLWRGGTSSSPGLSALWIGMDVDRFHREVLVPLQEERQCGIEDAPVDCREYGEGYHATFFTDPDGLKYQFVINPNRRKRA